MNTTEFIQSKIADVEQSIKSREEVAGLLRTATAKEWRESGGAKSKAERMREAEIEAKIIAKLKNELAHYQSLLKILPPP